MYSSEATVLACLTKRGSLNLKEKLDILESADKVGWMILKRFMMILLFLRQKAQKNHSNIHLLTNRITQANMSRVGKTHCLQRKIDKVPNIALP